MPGLRLLLRTAPFLVGAIAAAVWLRRSAPRRPQLPAPRAEPPAPPPEAPAPRPTRFDREPIDIVTVVDDLLDVGR